MNIRTIPLLLLASMSLKAATGFPKKIPCYDQVQVALDRAGTVTKWYPHPKGVAGSVEKFGAVEIHLKEKLSSVTLRGPKAQSTFSYLEPACHPVLSAVGSSEGVFGDLEFAVLLEKNPGGGLVYVWSPHMELSVGEVSELRNLKLGYPVSVVLDPKADGKLARSIASERKLPSEYLRNLQGQNLLDHDATIHFPTIIFYKGGKILRTLPGYSGASLPELTREILK